MSKAEHSTLVTLYKSDNHTFNDACFIHWRCAVGQIDQLQVQIGIVFVARDRVLKNLLCQSSVIANFCL